MDEADLTRRAAQMRGGEAEGRVQEFSARLEALAGGRQDAADLAAAEAARMLADLNESAAQMVREAAARVAADLDAVLDADCFELRLCRSSGTAGRAWATLRSWPLKPGVRSRHGD